MSIWCWQSHFLAIMGVKENAFVLWLRIQKTAQTAGLKLQDLCLRLWKAMEHRGPPTMMYCCLLSKENQHNQTEDVDLPVARLCNSLAVTSWLMWDCW